MAIPGIDYMALGKRKLNNFQPVPAQTTTGAIGGIPQTTPKPSTNPTSTPFYAASNAQQGMTGAIPGAQFNPSPEQKAAADTFKAGMSKNGLADYPKTGFNMADPALNTPTVTPSGGVVPPDYFKMATDFYAGQLAQAQHSADAQKGSLTDSFNRSNQINKDNRVLSDFFFVNKNNPYSGGSDYRAGLIGRERAQADEAAQSRYNSAIGQIDQQLADYTNNLSGQVAMKAYEMEQDAKQFGLQEAPITGEYNGKPTRDAINADRNFNLNLGQTIGFVNPTNLSYEDISKKMAANSAAWASANPSERQRLHEENLYYASLLGKTFDSGSGTYSQGQGFVGIPTQSFQNQQFNQGMENTKFQYQQIRDQIGDEQYKQKFDEDVRRYGIEFAADEAYRRGQLSISQQNANTSAGNLGLSRERFNFEKDPNNPDNIYKNLQIENFGGSESNPTTKQLESEYVSKLGKMTPEKRKQVFTDDESNIVNDLGIAGYNRLFNKYFDKDGNPK